MAGRGKRADDIRPYKTAANAPVFQRHGTGGGPAGAPGTAQQPSGLAGQSRCVPPEARQRLQHERQENERRCAVGLCPARAAHRRHEPPYWGAQGGRSPPALLFPHFFGKKWGPPSSAQATDRSLPGGPESSFPPLGLLSPRRPLRWVAAGAPLGPPREGAPPMNSGRPQVAPTDGRSTPLANLGRMISAPTGQAVLAPGLAARFYSRTAPRAALVTSLAYRAR